MKTSPYELVYRKEVVIPISIEIPTQQLLKALEVEENGRMEVWLVELLKLEEDKEKAHGAMIN